MITLLETCSACPEQYDAFATDDHGNKVHVGYLRLRHGRFTVECPDIGGQMVYEAEPDGDGMFTHEERPVYLDTAARAIHAHIRESERLAHRFRSIPAVLPETLAYQITDSED